MVKGSGKLNIDSVVLGEANINLLGSQKMLVGKFAMLNSENGTRFGAVSLDSWSAETLQKFQELIDFMERDLAAQLFSSGDTTPSSDVTMPIPDDEVPGL